MNSKQRKVVWGWIIGFAAMLIVPPWTWGGRSTVNSYRLFFRRPCGAPDYIYGFSQSCQSVDFHMLFIQVLILSLFAGALYVVFSSKAKA